MKIETSGSENHHSFFLKLPMPFTHRIFQFTATLYRAPEVWVHGYSSRTQNGRYILFHDYDNLEFKSIYTEIRWLQSKFRLSNYYIFKLNRPNSFHAVCLDSFPLSQLYEIQKQTSCDAAFVHSILRLQTREWILRWGSKRGNDAPVFHSVIPSQFNGHTKSNAHAVFLKKLGVPVSKKGPWDNGKLLALVDYNTANRTRKQAGDGK